ncbi:adenylate kinase [Streptomyces sp. Edi4]|uniref:adenylate kinase n=1 Tax=Streptomyces sp. Edi4 TaxID=3162527 RepID=UPI003305F4B4
MHRILVTGSTGAGKSTLARALGERIGVPYYEMDALFYAGPGWAEDPRFGTRVAEIASTGAWVFDSYGPTEVRDLLWERADTVVWLDYPRRVVMPRVLRRSARRTLTRERVFNGNRETLTGWFRPEHPARWSWAQHTSRAADIAARARNPDYEPLRTVRLTTPRQTKTWLARLPAAPAPPP